MYSHITAVIIATIPVFLIVILGVILRKKKVIASETDKGLTALLINVLVPCFILDSILGSKVASDLYNVTMLAAIGAGIVTISLLFVFLISPLIGMEKGSGRRSFTVATSIQNYGFMVVPLIMSLYPDKELLATLFLHNLGVELAMFTVAIMIFSGKLSLNPKILLKGPVIAVLTGVSLNVCSLDSAIPSFILTAVNTLGASAIPLALIAIGMCIGEVLPETKFTLKISLSAIAIRLLILPLLILAIAYILPIDDNIKKVLVMQAAMPAALFPILLARHYGGKPSLVAEVIVITSIVSFITMPFIVALGTYLLGL